MCRDSAEGRRHLPAISVDVVLIQCAQGGRCGRRDSGERAEQGVRVMNTITLDELRIVEVVAGVEPHACRQRGTQLLFMISRKQRDLHSVDLGAVFVDQVEERTRGGWYVR